MKHKAWLHRRDGYCWEFKSLHNSGVLFHKTRYGTLYAILNNMSAGVPFWIGRLHDNAWLTWERTLGATRIEFENGGSYIFPK